MLTLKSIWVKFINKTKLPQAFQCTNNRQWNLSRIFFGCFIRVLYSWSATDVKIQNET